MKSCLFPEHHKARSYGAVVALAVVVVLVLRFGRIIETIGLAVVYVAAGLLTARLVYAVERFVSLPAAAKRNYPAALWARLRWPSLTRNLALAYVDKHAQDDGDHKIRRPRARIRPDEFGMVARVRTVPGVGREELEDAAGHIGNAWKCQRVAVSQPGPGRLVVRGMRRDPLLEAFQLAVPSHPQRGNLEHPDGTNSPRRLYLGRDEHGSDRDADLANVPGIVLGGMPGSGKSTEITSFLTQLAPSPAVQLALLDGKGAGEFDDFSPRAYAMAGDDLDAALEVLEGQHALMAERLACVRTTLWVKNAWHVGPTVDWPLVVTVVDECQQYFDIAAAKGDKSREAKVRRCIDLVSSLVRRGRSVMMLTIVATQKPTTDSLPSSIRDNCPVAMSFSVRTTEAAAATLGTSIREYPSYSPAGLALPDYTGVATVTLTTGQDPYSRLRAPWVSEDQAAEVARASAHLRRDPSVLVPVVIPDDPRELVSG